MREQLRDPLGIAYIGFATGHRFEMLRVDHQQLKLPFQNVIDRLPINPGRFHRHVRASFLRQPIPQPQQILGHRPKLSNLSFPSTAQPLQPTRCDASLVHVQPTAPLVDHLHCLTPVKSYLPKTKGTFVLKRFSYTCFPTPSGATDRVSLECSGPTLPRLEALDANRPPVIGLRQCDATIFMRRVVPIGT